MSRLTKGTRKNSSHDASAEKADASTLLSFPFYEEGKVPQYHKYHANVSYLDELELIWGKRWGATNSGFHNASPDRIASEFRCEHEPCALHECQQAHPETEDKGELQRRQHHVIRSYF